MAQENKKKKKAPRQDWKAHWLPNVLYKLWLILFAAVKIAAGAAATVLLIGVICGFVFISTLGDYLQEDILPAANIDMEGYDHEQNSYLYYVDENGQIQEYQKIFAATSSRWAEYEDIPQNLINAAIAIEDHRFNEHQGVDWITTVKATARMFFGNASAGGSSITQQLIKNILLPEDDSADDVTVQRKVLEIFRAVQLEKRYDKETIMEMYLNVIYLGQGCKGVRSAAATYFGKELQTLSIAECASLISITNNPSLFDPYSDNVFEYDGEVTDGMQRNKMRQKLVLGEMLSYGFITQEEYNVAIEQPLVLKNGIDADQVWTKCVNETCDFEDVVKNFNNDGEDYFCPVCGTETPIHKSASQSNYSWFTDTVLRDVGQALAEQSGMTWNENTYDIIMQQIQSGGYHIYTTLDKKVQDQVDKIYADLEQIPDTRGGQQLQSAIVLTDNRTGDIVAIAGGVGEKTGYLEYNRATQAELQSGSSIKPITVYAPAFELGTITPATVIDDMPLSYGVVGSGAYPLNDDRRYSYSRTIFSGVISSVNAVAAQTLMKIGTNYSYEFATEKFGLSTLVKSYVDADGYEHSDIAVGPLALGAQTWGVHVREMTDAFGTFANNGIYRQGRTFTKVYDSDGELVLDNVQKSEQILSQKTVDYMNLCLVNATQSGTGYEANLSYDLGITTAGKTGTSGDSKDRWYCGFTGYYTAAIWCGFDEPETIYVTSYGNNPAAILWKKVMKPLHQGLSNKRLFNSDNLVTVSVCLDSGMLATEACRSDVRAGSGYSRVAEARVYWEDMPNEVCNKHVEVDYCTTGKGVATEFCKHFAEVDETVKIEKKSLVKLTQAEMTDIIKAEDYRLYKEILQDDYVYLTTNDGKDGIFKGFHNNVNNGVVAPYLVCPVHTEEAWEAYEKQNAPDPTEPSAPIDPNEGTVVPPANTPDPGMTVVDPNAGN